jgi:glycosyltransferase involved in cell wall biosynthesis
LHFAFVACNRNPALFQHDASYIYRCDNLSRALREGGHQVSLLHLTEFPFRHRFDVVVFHRPCYSLRLRLALAAARRRGAVAIADVDDLIFDDEFVEYSPAVRNSLLPLGAVRRQFSAHRRALALFDHITVSTEPLADLARRQFAAAQVVVIPNAVHHQWRSCTASSSASDSYKVITYLPGTRSHDRDFAQAAPALAELLARYPEVRLQVTGPLDFDLPARPGQVVRQHKVPFDAYHTHVQAAWVNLAPLEGTPFTRCKSALKVMEAGYWGIPTVSTPIPDVLRFTEAGAVPAVAPEAWLERLEELLDPLHYQAMTQDLRARVLALADVDAMAERLLTFVASLQPDT